MSRFDLLSEGGAIPFLHKKGVDKDMGYLSAGVIFLVVFSTIVLTYMSLPKRLQIEVMEWIDNA